MSEPHSGKSRRRFLADMLFLGGGATAAALLANSLGSGPEQVASTPAKTPAPKVCEEPKKMQPNSRPEPAVDGEFELQQCEEQEPKPVMVDRDPFAKQPPKPATRGRMIMPKHPNE